MSLKRFWLTKNQDTQFSSIHIVSWFFNQKNKKMKTKTRRNILIALTVFAVFLEFIWKIILITNLNQ